MPHCQKENHDRGSKSKKERQKKKEAAITRKKAANGVEEEELEKANLSNNIALAEGFGDDEVGCEEEREYVARFNMNKRSKKVRIFTTRTRRDLDQPWHPEQPLTQSIN